MTLDEIAPKADEPLPHPITSEVSMTVSRADARAKISTAAKATTAIADLVIEAMGKLRAVSTNGHGVLSEPEWTHSDLATARTKIDEALKALNDASWPSDADYDAAD